MLYSFGSFANASALTYCVAAALSASLFHCVLSKYLHLLDMRDCYDERVKTLYNKFMPDGKKEKTGIILRVFSFLSQAKKKGMEEAMKDANIKPEDQVLIDSCHQKQSPPVRSP